MNATGTPYHPPRDEIDVWVVEDNVLFRDTMADLLNEANVLRCSMVFGTCEEVLSAFEEGHLPQVILMDIGLPGMSGLECTRLIKRRSPAVHIIMLTVHHENEKIFLAICNGASGYLLKTAEPEDILRAVRQVHAGGAPIDAQIARRVLDMFTRLAVPQSDYGLSEREDEILHHLVDGLTKKEIAERLYLSRHTVDGHIRNIYAKLQVHSRTGAVAKALRENLI